MPSERTPGQSRPPTSERWSEVSRVVDGAIELPAEERAAFVEHACGGDANLRREVERFLAACERADRAGGFLNERADAYAAPVLQDVATRSAALDAAVPEALAAALSGRYAVEREIGRGGMAAVYQARDIKHGRPVAIKVLRPELAAALGPARFLREIEHAARLQHPHIVPLYDSGEVPAGHRDPERREGEGPRLLYYIMPYVEGESLRERLARQGQLPLDEALRIATEVAGALDYAHRHRVVHRDIKPENILLSSGQAMVADFGIARAITAAGGERLTETGLSLGTPAYMSPEQATAERDIDGRSDIYSLGCVLYEMLVGEPPYTGPTAHVVLAKRLHEPVPRISTLRETVPEHVERAISRALAKAPADRYVTAQEFAAGLVVPTGGKATPRVPRRAVRALAGALAVLALVSVALLVARTLRAPTRSSAPTRQKLTFVGNAIKAAISPDGQFIAYVVRGDSLDHLLVQDMSGGAPDTIYTHPWFGSVEWSPDGTRLLLGLAGRAAIVPRLGGSERSIGAGMGLTAAAVSASWLPHGKAVSLTQAGERRILVVDLPTGAWNAIPVSASYTLLTVGPWSPNGQLLAVATEAGTPIRWSIQAVTRDGRMTPVAEDSVRLGSPRWSPDGKSLYYARRDSAIWRVQVDSRTGQRRRSPTPVFADLAALPMGMSAGVLGGGWPFSLTADGRQMVYASGARSSNLWMLEPAGLGLPTRAESLTTGTALRWSPVVSPDGRSIGFAQQARGVVELFRMPIGGGAASQITFGARVWPGSRIAWSPDATRMAFISVRGGRAQVIVANVESGQLRTFARARASIRPAHLAWSPGSLIAYVRASDRKISLLDPETEVERPLVADTAPPTIDSPQYSPDGSRVAVLWTRSWQTPGIWVFGVRDSSRVEVLRIPMPASRSLDYWAPVGWSSDGRYIYVGQRTLSRLDSRHRSAPVRLLTAPFREADCTPAGPRHPAAFICAAFNFHSDIFMIENFDAGAP